ncbi:MAG: LLM class flavin-dependent oxidoreductase [Gammaproteobacteria bacterium]
MSTFTALEEYRRTHVPLYNDNRMKLGVFGINVSGGGSISRAPTSLEPTFAHNLKVAQAAEAAGFEFLVPFGRWKSFGGDTEYNGNCMEVYTWAAALAARTDRIMLFATSHVGTVHPVLAAKQGATIDHISNGRWGLNVVCGWYTPEMEMFGAAQLGHDERYRRAGEWVEVIKRLWCENHFDHHGEYYRVDGGYLEPKPVQQPYPVIVNAGASEAGREFSARHVDFNFITMDSNEAARRLAADVRARARVHGRDIGVLGNGYVIVRDTEQEAREALAAIVAAGDWDAARNIMRVLGIESASFNAQIDQFARRFVVGWGGFLLCGNPEQVVDGFIALERAGVEGMALMWHDPAVEIPYFAERVMPLMRAAGLRI